MIKKQGSKKHQTQQPAPVKQQQGRGRKIFTVIICVVVALGLMLPITGLGVASCSGSDLSNAPQQNQPNVPDDASAPSNNP